MTGDSNSTKRKTQKRRLITISITAVFILLLYILTTQIIKHHRYEAQLSRLEEHSKVIANDLWTYNQEGMIEYLKLASVNYHYKSVSVFDNYESLVVDLHTSVLNRFEQILFRLSLIKLHSKRVEVSYRNQNIGYFIVHWYSKNIYTYLQILGTVLLVGLVFALYRSLLQSKQLLERKVEERTGELQEANRALAISESYNESVINSMPSILISIDARQKIYKLNTLVEHQLNCKQEEAEGRSVEEIVPALKEHVHKIQSCINNEKVMTLENLRRKYKDRTIIEDITIYPLHNSPQKGAVIRIDDVTNRFEMEERLHQSRKMDAIGQLAGGIAHDFNNMLGGILGAAELLEMSSSLSETEQRHIKIIIRAARRAADLTAKLLAFGRAGSHISTNIDMHLLVEEAVAILRRSLDKIYHIRMNFQAEHSVIVGDNSQLQNAIINICINASHAMEHGGTIEIESKNSFLDEYYCRSSTFDLEAGNYFELIISDSGCGIAADDLHNIFDPFFTTKPQDKGSGLGLSAVYGTLLDHKGAVTVYSERGQGSDFHLYLPLSSSEAVFFHQNDTLIRGSGTILFVDDEEILRLSTKSMLNNLGYTVLTASNGAAALKLVQRQFEKIDLILMDITMPEMSGEETSRRILEDHPELPIILCSGFTKKRHFKKLERSGIAGFIRKPFGLAELSTIIASSLSNSPQTTSTETPSLDYKKKEATMVPGSPSFSNINVLFIDDNEMILEIAQSLFERLGTNFFPASDSKEALTLCNNTSFDLICIDLHLKGESGISAAQQMFSLASQKEALFVSVSGDYVEIEGTVFQKALEKPFSIEDLRSLLSESFPVQVEEQYTDPTKQANEHLQHTLPPIHGFSIEEGLARLENSEELYRTVLRQFMNEYHEVPNQLQNAFQNGETEEVLEGLHSLKGIAANLSAHKIQEISGQIEEEIKHSRESGEIDDAQINTLFSLLETEMQKSIRNLKEVLVHEEPENIETPIEIPTAEAERIASELRSAASVGDIDLLSALSVELQAKYHHPLSAKLISLIENMEMDEVFHLAQKIGGDPNDQ